MPATRVRWFFAVLIVSLLAFASSPRVAAEAVPGQVLVKLRHVANGPQLQAPRRLPAGARVVRDLPLPGWQLIQLAPDQSVRDAVRWFRRQPEVTSAEPNQRYHLHAAPTDPLYPRLTGLPQISAPGAWTVSTGSTNVVVAVCDTGIDYRHPDLAPNMWRNPGEIPGNGLDDDGNGWIDDVHGIDVAEGDGDPLDDAGHGTHVAGTIGAVGNNALGVAGVCWNVRLMALRVGKVDGFASTAEIITAFDYAVKMRKKGVNLRAINCSWGGGEPSLALLEAINAAGAADILVVCSAGNDHKNTDELPSYPAGYDAPQVISVAAATSCDEPASFSNFGRLTVDLAAPGSAILSTYRSGSTAGANYGVLSGTSMAAPHVTGAAALLFAVRNDLTAAQAKSVLLATVDTEPAWKDLVRSGGRLNLERAVRSLLTANLPAEPVVIPPGDRLSAITRLPSGRWANDHSTEPSLSADGRWVAFTSDATNLVTGDTEGFTDVFLHDRQTATTLRVSQTPAGTGANADCGAPVISADGRFVAFVTEASNLVTSDSNGVNDVYLWSRETGQIELISVRPNGRAGSQISDSPALSADGTFVAFASDAPDLIASDRNFARDVFVRDRSRGATERVSVTNNGGPINGSSDAPAISSNGRWVAFHSGAEGITSVATDRNWNIYVRDRTAQTTEIVSLRGADAQAEPGDSDSVYPAISGDGRFVIFHSLANNFTDAPPDDFLTVFIRDRQEKTLTAVSVSMNGEAPTGDSYVDAINEDGRYVTYSSTDTRVVPGGIPNVFRALLWDRLSGTTQSLGVNAAGYPAGDAVFLSRPSRDGRFVVFGSYAYELVPEDGNGVGDVFVLDRGDVRPDLGARPAGTNAWTGFGALNPRQVQRVGVSATAAQPAVYEVRLINAGEARPFLLRSTNPPPAGWSVQILAPATNGTAIGAALGSAGGWTTPVIPAGGSFVLRAEIRPPAESLLPEWELRLSAHATNGPSEALDAVSLVTTTARYAPSSRLISRNTRTGVPAMQTAEVAALSGDGRYVVFSSEADNLDERDDGNFVADVFRFDRLNATLTRISDAAETNQANADSQYATLSTTGQRVAFQSRASNLVLFDNNDVEDVFVRDLSSGVTSRASQSTLGSEGDRGSDSAMLSGNGRFVAFNSVATNFVTGDTNHATDVFLRDLDQGTLEVVSRTDAGGFGNADSDVAAISANGRFILFTSFASNLVPNDRNGFIDLFLWDRATKQIELISANTNGVPANGPSAGGTLSDDGHWVTFFSYASDLGFGGDGVDRRPYLLERQSHVLHLVSDVVPPAPDGLEIRSALLSPNGERLALGVAPRCGYPAGTAFSQVFVADRLRDTLVPVSVTAGGEFADGHAFIGHFSGDNRYLVYESSAANLRGEYAWPQAGQVYLADLLQPAPDLVGQSALGTPWRGLGQTSSSGLTFLQLPTSTSQLTREFQIRLINRGDAPDQLTLMTPGDPAAHFDLQFETAGSLPADTTAAILAGRFASAVLPPGGELLIRVRATPRRPAEDATLVLEAGSLANPTRRDVLRFEMPADVDSDGLPDGWERQWFGALTVAGSTTDADQDGFTDRAEWLAGTDPKNPLSNLRLLFSTDSGNGSHTLRWEGTPHRYYQLQRSPAPGGVFENVTDEPLEGGTGIFQITDILDDPLTPVVYRLRADLP